MTSLTPELRSQRARIAAYTRAATYDGREVTQAARDTWNRRWEDRVDPDRTLPEPERLRRAAAARRAHMARLSYLSAKARMKE